MEPETISNVALGYSLDNSPTKCSGVPQGLSKSKMMVLKSESSFDLQLDASHLTPQLSTFQEYQS